jgi:hypothetical protein
VDAAYFVNRPLVVKLLPSRGRLSRPVAAFIKFEFEGGKNLAEFRLQVLDFLFVIYQHEVLILYGLSGKLTPMAWQHG